MCGITGMLGFIGVGEPRRSIQSMTDAIAHRGPDAQGSWIDQEAECALGHRRLSILDLSPAGHQPMASPSGRHVIVFNGEIYNYLELRSQLETENAAFKWRGKSDTEVLLAGIVHWGIDSCLRRLNGMFAFALWDRKTRTLLLARDRTGEKPLYYGHSGDSFVFGSELKAIVAHPRWENVIDREALSLFMRHGYVPAPLSIYKGICKLPPAHYLTITNAADRRNVPVCYWDLPAIVGRNERRSAEDIQSLTDELDVRLREAVGRRMVSDVPIGAFLSGGYDSTMVVAQAQAQSATPLQTFSIGFNEAGFNEAQHARVVAAHLGTSHNELFITPAEALSVVPLLPTMYDEPFADSSQVPTYIVSQLARRKVTVALSGDGGDEIFCGYNRYALGFSVWNRMRRMPSITRQLVADTLAHAPTGIMERMQGFLPERWRVSYLPDRLPKLAAILRHSDSLSFYQTLVSTWTKPSDVVIDGYENQSALNDRSVLVGSLDLREQMMLFDMQSYLPDDILTKVDRASMSVSLEARVPLLDHHLIEFAWRLPLSTKIRNGQGKWLFRRVLDRYVPRNLMERPKQGFGVPIEEWLRGPLRDWAEDLLDTDRLKADGFLKHSVVKKIWAEHLSGTRRWHYQLWNILMFQAWRRKWT